MLPLLEKELNALEERRTSWIKQLEEQTPAQRTFQTEPGKWSATEVLHHLFLVEDGVIEYIEKKMNAPKLLKKKGLKSALSSSLLNFILRLPIRVKAPVERVKPKGAVTFEEISAQSKHCFERWQTLLEKFTEEQLQLLCFRHPIAGAITIHQTFHFLCEHMDHHLQQLNRILNHPQYPKEAVI